MIKVTKKALTAGTQVYLSPSYIMTSHWAIALAHVENKAMMDTFDKLSVFLPGVPVEPVDDKKVQSVIPTSTNMRVKSNGVIRNASHDLDPKHDLVVFAEDGDEVYFNRDYVKLLELAGETLFGADASGPFTNKARTLTIMPKGL